MNIKSAEEAKKIVSKAVRRHADDGYENPYSDEYYAAKGGLDALRNWPEVLGLVEALEFCWEHNVHSYIPKALARYRKAVRP